MGLKTTPAYPNLGGDRETSRIACPQRDQATVEDTALAKRKVVQSRKVGDYVRILHTAYPPGRIVELRGPLAPGGMQVYRVRTGRKRNPTYIELREDQLEPITTGS